MFSPLNSVRLSLFDDRIIYEFSTNRGKYYTVYIFSNLNFPIINNIIEVKIKGQTRTIYDL